MSACRIPERTKYRPGIFIAAQQRNRHKAAVAPVSDKQDDNSAKVILPGPANAGPRHNPSNGQKDAYLSEPCANYATPSTPAVGTQGFDRSGIPIKPLR
jgi:hypothetical protein